MDESEQGFDTAEELFEALATTDALARRRVLGWVAANPAEAIALGTHGGEDVLGLLLRLTDTGLDYPFWEDLAIAIGAFDAPRSTEFFVGVLAGARSFEEAWDAANQLTRRDRAGLTERLVEILLAEGPTERHAATASLLIEEDLPGEAAVVVAALEEERPAPELTPQVTAAWIAQLSGPFAASARDRLVEQGQPALAAIREAALSGTPESRGAAVEALLELGDDEWLARELLGDDEPLSPSASSS